MSAVMLGKIANHFGVLNFNGKYDTKELAKYVTPKISTLHWNSSDTDWQYLSSFTMLTELIIFKVPFEDGCTVNLQVLCPQLKKLHLMQTINVVLPVGLLELRITADGCMQLTDIDKCSSLEKIDIDGDVVLENDDKIWNKISALPKLTCFEYRGNEDEEDANLAAMFAKRPYPLTHVTCTWTDEKSLERIISSKLVEFNAPAELSCQFWSRVCETCTNLISLGIGEEEDDTIPQINLPVSLYKLSNLVKLSILRPMPTTNLYDIAALPSLRKLIVLCCQSNGTSSYKHVCTSLRKFEISGTPSSGYMSIIRDCFPNIESLHELTTPAISIQILLQNIATLRNLKKICGNWSNQVKQPIALNMHIQQVVCFGEHDTANMVENVLGAFCPNCSSKNLWRAAPMIIELKQHLHEKITERKLWRVFFRLAFLEQGKILFANKQEQDKCYTATLQKVHNYISDTSIVQEIVKKIKSILDK